jgi:repressor LexA
MTFRERRSQQTQEKVLRAIREWFEQHGYPPTYQEIADLAGLRAASTALVHVEALQKRGVLTFDRTRSRTIRLLSTGGAGS